MTTKGFGLLEVLVALALLSVGLLGLAALHLSGMKLVSGAHARSQASIAAADLIERVRANRAALALSPNPYHVPDVATASARVAAWEHCRHRDCACTARPCDSGSLALHDLGEWYQYQRLHLPGLGGTNPPAAIIEFRDARLAVITLSWADGGAQVWPFALP